MNYFSFSKHMWLSLPLIYLLRSFWSKNIDFITKIVHLVISPYQMCINEKNELLDFYWRTSQLCILKILKIVLPMPFSSVQSLSRVWLFATPWISACQASLSITNSWSLFKLMPIESVMPSSHLFLCHHLLLLPPIRPSIRDFSNDSPHHMRWPKYWSFSFSISPSNEHPGLISFRMDWLDLLAAQAFTYPDFNVDCPFLLFSIWWNSIQPSEANTNVIFPKGLLTEGINVPFHVPPLP